MSGLFIKFQVWNAKKRLRAERADFYFDLSASLEDKVSVFATLKKYEARARRRKTGLAPLYLQMMKGARKGSLAQAMEGIASTSEQIILDALQGGGDDVLAAGLAHLSGLVEKADSMVSQIRKAVTYPLVLLTLFSVLVAAFSVFAIPVLEQISPAENWPALGQLLYRISWLVRHWGVFMALAFVMLLALFAWSLPNWTGRTRRIVDRHLPYSMYRDYQSALLIVAVSSQMQSGVSLKSALERASRFASPWLRWHLREVLRRLSGRDATAFGGAFSTGLLSPMLEDRVQDASEKTNPQDSFVKIGNGAIHRTSMSIERSAKVLNSVLLLFCGVALLIMMGGFFSTVFSLQTGIRQEVQLGR